MKYCCQCAGLLVRQILEGDDRERHVCSDCATVFYQNPKIITGCLPIWRDQVLLCRRAIEPRYGLWTLPAGFMENGETTQAGAVRETLEEAQLNLDPEQLQLYCYLDIPRINQVYVMFRATMAAPDFAPGRESLEVALFSEQDIPWEQLAFPSIEVCLRHYFEDRCSGNFPVRVEDIQRRPPSTFKI